MEDHLHIEWAQLRQRRTVLQDHICPHLGGQNLAIRVMHLTWRLRNVIDLAVCPEGKDKGLGDSFAPLRYNLLVFCTITWHRNCTYLLSLFLLHFFQESKTDQTLN